MTTLDVPDAAEAPPEPGEPRSPRRRWPWVIAVGVVVAAVTVIAVRQGADAHVEVTTGWAGGLPDEVGGVAVDGAPSAHVRGAFGDGYSVIQIADTIEVQRLFSIAHDTDRTVTITDIDGVRARASGLLVDEGGCQLSSTDASVWVTASAGEVPADPRAEAAPFTADVALAPRETAFVWLTSSFDGSSCVPEDEPHVGSMAVFVDHVVRGTEGSNTVELEPIWFVPDLDGYLDDAVEITRR